MTKIKLNRRSDRLRCRRSADQRVWVASVCHWAVALMFVMLSAASCRKPPAVPPQSLLLITADTLRADRLGAYGHHVIRTPNLDQLARRSQQFSTCYSQYPLTVPSHASLMTSRYPDDLDMWTNRDTLAADAETLAEFLNRRGFRTAAFTSGILSFPCGLEQGFEHVTLRRKGSERRPVTELLQAAGSAGSAAERRFASADDLVRQAISWLDGIAEGERYFIWLHLWEPHMAYDPAPPYNQVYNRRQPGTYRSGPRLLMGRADDQPPLTDEEIQEVIGLYDGEVSQMDGALGMFFRALAARGEPLPLICFTADHGECLRGPRDYFGHGRGLYEDEVAVPLLVFCQSDTAAGVLVSRAAELVDVAPTAVRGLGLDLGPWRGGRDLLAPQADDVDQTARMYLGSHYRAAVEGTTKVLLDASDGSCFVYDLLADAQELNPVAVRPEDAGDKTARLRQLLAFEQASPQQTPEVAADRLEALEALGYLN